MIVIILSLIVAFVWGIDEYFYKKVTNEYKNTSILMSYYIFEIISFLLFVLIFDIDAFQRFNPKIYIYLIPLFLITAFICKNLYLNSIKLGNLSIVSPILASDPVYIVLIGMILFHETISLKILIMIVIICSSICTLNFVSSKTKKKTKKLAIFLASLYAFFTSISTTLEKSIYLSGFKLTDFYFHYALLLIIAVVMLFIYMKLKNIKYEKPNKDMILSVFLGRTGYFLYSYLISTSFISIVAPLTGLYSVITHILATKLLHEKLTRTQEFCITLIIVSTILLLIFNS